MAGGRDGVSRASARDGPDGVPRAWAARLGLDGRGRRRPEVIKITRTRSNPRPAAPSGQPLQGRRTPPKRRLNRGETRLIADRDMSFAAVTADAAPGSATPPDESVDKPRTDA